MQRVNQTYRFDGAELKIIRSERKSISVSVSGGVVTLRAPFSSRDQELLVFLKKYRAWIEERLASSPKVPAFSDGDTIEIFSQKYTIQQGLSGFVGDRLYLKEEQREEHLKRLLRAVALEKMSALTREIAEKYGFSYRTVKISSARTRWGSCNSKGIISYSFRVCFLTREEAYYVAVHELCHTRQMNHSKAFWKEVERVLPNYKKTQKTLKNSPAMSFL